jgi:hypothetical protein
MLRQRDCVEMIHSLLKGRCESHDDPHDMTTLRLFATSNFYDHCIYLKMFHVQVPMNLPVPSDIIMPGLFILFKLLQVLPFFRHNYFQVTKSCQSHIISHTVEVCAILLVFSRLESVAPCKALKVLISVIVRRTTGLEPLFFILYILD